MDQPSMLVVITGPIGAGKSTVAELLGRRIARTDRTVAVVDLDDIAFMQRGRQDLTEFWRRAGAAHCALVAAWFAQRVGVVIAHGPFFESGSYDELFATAPDGATVRHVLLDVSVDQALRRVSDDPDRRPDAMSREPAFLRSTHEAFRDRRDALPSIDLTIDTNGRTAAEVADLALAALLPNR